MHHFKAIGEFKLELQSGNAQSWSKSAIFFQSDHENWQMTLKKIGQLFCATSSFVHHFIAIGEFKLELQSGNAQFGLKSMIFFVPCDLEISHMTFKDNKATPLCYFKRFASFHSHQWNQTGVRVRKRPIRVKIGHIFFYPCDLEFDRWPWKTIGYLLCAISISVHHFVAISELKTGVTVRKCPVWVKNGDVFCRVNLKFDGWPWKTK